MSIFLKKSKLLFLLVSICIIGCIFTCTPSYADENDSKNDTEPFSVQDTDAMLHQVADKIAFDLDESGLLSDSGVKAQDYVYSIYQYLQSTIHPDLTNIKNTLQNGIYVDTSKIVSLLYSGSGSPVQDISTQLEIIKSSLNTPFLYGSSTPSVLGRLVLIEDQLQTASGVTVATSAAAIQSAVGTSNTTLSTISSRVNTTNTRLNTVNTNLTNIQSSIDGFYDAQWNDITSNFNYIGCNYDIEDAFTNHVITSDRVFFKIRPTLNLGGNVIRIRLPYVFSNYSVYSKVTLYYKTGVDEYDNDVYVEVPTLSIINNGQQIYLYNLPNQMFEDNFIICLTNEYEDITTSTSSTLFKVEYIGQDKMQSWFIRDSLSTSNIERMLSNIKDEVASDDMVKAKKESQEVIDDTLEGFTGSGSAAAKVSDTSAMKGLSSDLRNGLSGGGSVVNATSVLNSNNQFWMWFTQTTSDNINNPYPAPQVRNTRSSGDLVIDFLTNNNKEVQDLLNNEDQR